MNISTTIAEAVAYYGTKANLARALDILPQSVNTWCKDKGVYVPESSALKLYIITDGKLGDKVEHEVPKRKNSILQ